MDIKEQIISIVAECMDMNPSNINCESELFDMEGYDSMRSVMILSRIEDHFDIMVPEDDIFDITTIDAWVKEIEKLTKKMA